MRFAFREDAVVRLEKTGFRYILEWGWSRLGPDGTRQTAAICLDEDRRRPWRIIFFNRSKQK